MKVLLINGSPHEKGCTYTALTEVEKSLNENGIETEIFWIGNKPIGGCVACKGCINLKKCVYHLTQRHWMFIWNICARKSEEKKPIHKRKAKRE